jgi:hypothetical protein
MTTIGAFLLDSSPRDGTNMRVIARGPKLPGDSRPDMVVQPIGFISKPVV